MSEWQKTFTDTVVELHRYWDKLDPHMQVCLGGLVAWISTQWLTDREQRNAMYDRIAAIKAEGAD